MRTNTRFILAGLLTVTLVVAPVVGIAQDKPKTPPAGNAADKPAPAARAIPPFRGTVAAVDKDAKTVTVGERVFHVSSETKLTKGNQPATIADITVGDVITGNYTKGDDGKLTAKTMKFGPKPVASEKADKKEKAPEKKKTENAE